VVQHARPPASGQIFIRERGKTGFAVRLIATGAVSFIWEGRIKKTGVKRRVTIGQWPTWSVAAASNVAAEYRGMAAKGQDPAGERIQAREEMTFGELVEWYLENHTRPHKKSWRTDERRLRALKGWNRRRLADIKTGDIGRMTSGLERHAAASRQIGRLSWYGRFSTKRPRPRCGAARIQPGTLRFSTKSRANAS
jgi:hypothetical protein